MKPPGWFVTAYTIALLVFAWVMFDWRVATLVGLMQGSTALLLAEKGGAQ